MQLSGRAYSLLAAVGTTLGMLMTSVVTAAPAHAAGLATCALTATFTYSPGLLLQDQTVDVDSNRSYAACATTAPGVTSGLSIRTVTVTTSCLNLGNSTSGVETITWNNGQSSTFTYNETSVNAGGQSTILRTGTITAGLFAGATAQSAAVAPSLNALNCLTPPGITSKTAAGELIIASA